ncbi:hypothetical protein F4678DRAFT_481869 [Xylaria arbuscula]|nr:hypothetical protein F4678DRAFT_481869 [Xylaria arbuscula]
MENTTSLHIMASEALVLLASGGCATVGPTVPSTSASAPGPASAGPSAPEPSAPELSAPEPSASEASAPAPAPIPTSTTASALPPAPNDSEAPHSTRVASPSSGLVPVPSAAEPIRDEDIKERLLASVHPSVRDAIKIEELWQEESEDWPMEALQMAQLPAQRSVTKLNKPFLPDPYEWDMSAAVGQCVGQQAAVPCKRCKMGKGPFSGGCVVVPDGFKRIKKSSCCFNCRYQWQYKKCKWSKKK